MGVMTDAEWEQFLRESQAEYDSFRSQYGEACDAVLRGLASAADSGDPAQLVSNISAAVRDVGAAFGPAGDIAARIVAGLMTLAGWLVDAWPALPDYSNRDGWLQTARALGYRDVAGMAKDGWIAWNWSTPHSYRRPDGMLPANDAEVAACLLAPRMDRGARGGFEFPSQSWELGLARSRAMRARMISYQSQVASRRTYQAICVHLPSAPDELRRRVLGYVPLLLTLPPRSEFARPEWWPKADRGVEYCCLGLLGWGFADAPEQQDACGGPLVAWRLVQAAAAASGAVPSRRIVGEAMRSRRRLAPVMPVPPKSGGPGAAVVVLAALKWFL